MIAKINRNIPVRVFKPAPAIFMRRKKTPAASLLRAHRFQLARRGRRALAGIKKRLSKEAL